MSPLIFQTSLPTYSLGLQQHLQHSAFLESSLAMATTGFSSASVSPGGLATPASAASRSPRAPPLKNQAKSLHAQTHKLRRQVRVSAWGTHV